MERIIEIEVEGQIKLGFDTGLNARSFAQAKLAQFINRTGTIVYPGGKTGIWRPEGAAEHQAVGSSEKTLVIYGPSFPGERLDRLIEGTGESALDALRCWVRAQAVLGDSGPDSAATLPGEPLSGPWPAAALLSAGSSEISGAFPPGTVLFPPEVPARRAVESEGTDAWLKGAERWTHPDLAGKDAAVFAAAAMLYRIICGEPPYHEEDIERLHTDIREGVYTPPSLVVPGLDADIAALVSNALAPVSASGRRPSLEDFIGKIGPPLSGGPERFLHPASDEERAKTRTKREQFDRKKTVRVKTRRFLRRNRAVIGGVIAALAVAALVVGSIAKSRRDLPTTKGMPPLEVIAAYYSGFETLDHTLMEACVTDKAGKGDISMVMNLFVISKVREAYEMKRPVITAREWLDSGAASTDLTVAGVTDLHLEGDDEDENDGEVRYRAAYTLWLPAAYMREGGAEDNPEEPSETAALPALPGKTSITDEVRLVLRKGAWRIAEIERRVNGEG
ncbi:MAG: hypothetical protein LBB98_10515 [Treponema sp.]|jgi:hypothetical protein|nr:hypothetical protein [Treponema sp.]